jgi:hypothetical protein
MKLPNFYADMSDAEFNVRLSARTGFASIAAMIAECKPTYRPTCDCSDPFQRTLAYRFDAAMYAAGDDRRAFLSGTPTERDLARFGG